MQAQYRLDMDRMGMQTLNQKAEIETRNWVAKSSRFDKGFVDKNIGSQDLNDPWKIRTYAPSVKKKQVN